MSDEGDLRRVIMWIESFEWNQSWGHVLGDLKQLHQRLGTAVVGQEGEGNCELVSVVFFLYFCRLYGMGRLKTEDSHDWESTNTETDPHPRLSTKSFGSRTLG